MCNLEAEYDQTLALNYCPVRGRVARLTLIQTQDSSEPHFSSTTSFD